MNKTSIEWVKNPDGTQGYTLNPITGCLNHTPAGLCLGGMFPCYAYKLANGRLRQRYLANPNTAPQYAGMQIITLGNHADPFYPRFWKGRLTEKDLWCDKPKGIFVCDMSDLFGIGIPYEWTRQVMEVIEHCPQHRFFLLTKQPQNLPQWSPFPSNVYLGVTVTDQTMWNDALHYLTGIRATVKYVSIEPHLGKIVPSIYAMRMAGLGWIIDGAQTKPYKPPEIEWVEEIVRACDKAGVKVFLKDNLIPLFANDVKANGHNQLFFRRDKLRQEMPNG